MVSVVATFKNANTSSGAKLVAVSNYVAAHLQTIFGGPAIHRQSHRSETVMGRRYRVSDSSSNANKLQAAYHTWLIYRNTSKLPLARAISSWTQYVWNGFRMYRYARPQE